METQVVLIDDDLDFLEVMQNRLIRAGFTDIQVESDPARAVQLFQEGAYCDIALIDMTMPDMNGIEVLERVKAISPGTECIMVTAVNDARAAVECLKKGAYDYLIKPVSQEDLVFVLNRALERKRLLEILDIRMNRGRLELANPHPFEPIITRAPAVLKILKEAELHAGSEVPVLITGESGTGKELLARAIHAASPRAAFPFTAVNMASISAGLFDAEFFGHTKGAFTGAERARAGYLAHSDRGTLFLDEIGTMPLALQGKLLRVLQDGEYLKLGTSNRQKSDVRFIAATNENLDQLMTRGQFRKDLYYRIRGGWLHLPPLRERKEDIPLLVNTFVSEMGITSTNGGIDESTMCLLLEYDYPGNIRELMSIIQSAANLAQGQPIHIACLPEALRNLASQSTCVEILDQAAPQTLAEVEREHIVATYRQTGNNKSQTARMLGIGLNTLRRKLKSYDIA